MISNCGKDERGAYSGGTAGDQSGSEYTLISWYNGSWNCVLRHPNPSVRAEISKLATSAAQNNNIGYDQNERLTFWNQLQRFGYDPAAITVPCEADCSSSTASIIKAVGYRLNMSGLKSVSQGLTTYNMRSALKAAGFDVLTETKYLSSASYLLAGDILLNDSSHTAINVTNGGSADTSYGGGSSTNTSTAPSNPSTSSGGASTGSGNISLPTTTNVKHGDLVAIQEGAKWWTNGSIPAWVFGMNWYVLSINGMRAVLGRSEDKKYNIVSPIHAGYLKIVKSEEVTAGSTTQTGQQQSNSDNGISGDTYLVQKGDTLWGIAEKFFGAGKGWMYPEIQKANGMTGIVIYAGQTIKLPSKE